MTKTSDWYIAIKERNAGEGYFLDIKAENRCSMCNKPRATWQSLKSGLTMCEVCGDRYKDFRL